MFYLYIYIYEIVTYSAMHILALAPWRTSDAPPGGGWYAGPPGEQLKRAKRKAQAFGNGAPSEGRWKNIILQDEVPKTKMYTSTKINSYEEMYISIIYIHI